MFKLPTSSAFNNQQTQDIYLVKGNGPSKVLVETMEGVTARIRRKHPGGVHTYPTDLTMEKRLKFGYFSSY
ncbi:MAG: hypothetical protein WAZ77_10790 [Candidatus Nitrosopolaris sp.]